MAFVRVRDACTYYYTALLHKVDDIIRETNKKHTFLILLDFKKAFGTINHELIILVSRLHYNVFNIYL